MYLSFYIFSKRLENISLSLSLSPVELFNPHHNDSTADTLTLLPGASSALQPSSSTADARQRKPEANNPFMETTASHLSSLSASGSVSPAHFSWNTSANPAPRPLLLASNSPLVIKPVKVKSPVDQIDPDKTSLFIKYIHKKFSWKTLSSDHPSNQSSYVHLEPKSSRSSVIVGSSSTSLSTEFNEIFKQEESGEEIDDIGSSVDLEDLDLRLEGHSDIQAICLTYLAEDVPYMEERKNVFVKAWNEINMGEKLVANWIAFARDGVPLTRDFQDMANGQLM